MPSPQRNHVTTAPRVLLAVVIVAVISSVFVASRLQWARWHPSAFVLPGFAVVDPHAAPRPLMQSHPTGYGYDGQYFYRLALTPFTTKDVEHGLWLDSPAHRQQRIIYPLLAWALGGGGEPGPVLWALLVINWLGLLAVTALGALFAIDSGRSPFAGLLFALIPGLLVALSVDTSEITAITLGLAALLLLRRGRSLPAVIALSLATLARETTLLFALGLLICVILARIAKRPYSFGRRPVPLIAAITPLAVYIGWQAFLWARWGHPALLGIHGRSDLGAPVIGIFQAAGIWAARGPSVTLDNVLLLAASLAFIGLALMSVRRSDAPPHEKAGFVLALVMVFFFRETIWDSYANFLRALVEVNVLGLLIVLGDQRRQLLPLTASVPELIVYLAMRLRVSA